MKLSSLLSGIAFISLAFTGTAQAAQSNVQVPASAMAPVDFAKFTPKPSTKVKIDYAVWDGILNNIVFLTGLSTRQIARKPDAIIGSLFVWEHSSPLRQEGNKIPFSKLKSEHIETLREYKSDLENLSTTVNIASLPKAEQLAYWLNLHNVSIITALAENYPVREPQDLRIGPNKELLHDAKMINVAGKKLSLRDIRENIVYPNWSDTKVIYGFFLGDIGSPSIQSEAFTAQNTDRLLNLSADEFINSLRSFSRGGISKLYKDVARFYFTDFEKDLRDHFQVYMWDEVWVELDSAKELKINKYETDIADMEGGHGARVMGNVTMDGDPIRSSQGYAIASYTNQIKEKTRTLLKQGKIKRGVVTVGEDEEEEEKKKDTRKDEVQGIPEANNIKASAGY